MINLNDVLGFKRKLVIEGFGQFSLSEKSIELVLVVQILDSKGVLVENKNIMQNRVIRYYVTNDRQVNSQFNPVESGGIGEFDYFFNSMQTIPMPTLVLQLAQKLISRGLID